MRKAALIIMLVKELKPRFQQLRNACNSSIKLYSFALFLIQSNVLTRMAINIVVYMHCISCYVNWLKRDTTAVVSYSQLISVYSEPIRDDFRQNQTFTLSMQFKCIILNIHKYSFTVNPCTMLCSLISFVKSSFKSTDY